jgi:hypothetical protein
MPNLLIDEDTGLLAAEFVLGTLDSAERANAQSLLNADPGFTAMVRIWERRFGELHLMVEPVEPDAAIFERIKAKLATMLPAEPAAGKLPDLPAGPAPEPLPPAMGAGEGEASPAPESATGDEAPKAQPEPLPEPATVGAASVDPSVVPEIAPPPALEDEPRDLRPEVAIGVIRSRRRWRALGIFMTLVVMALAGLVAAWKVVPDRLPPALRPAEVMMAIGIEPGGSVPQPPAVKRAPESQFDE